MLKRALFLIIAIISSLSLFSQEDDKAVYEIVGSWMGTLDVGKMELRIVFNITQDSNSVYNATMDSPDQGAKDIPVDEVVYKKNYVEFKLGSMNGRFEGYIKNDTLINGKWFQNKALFDLILIKQEEAFELIRPQEPKPPFPYLEEEVTFKNESAEIELAGTLTLPKEGDNFPCVILVTGSGAQNRDEEIFGHKPFMVIADHFTRNGIAVLRYDDRGIGESKGDFKSANTKDFTDDALSALKFLKNHHKIDKDLIGIAGHSEGGMVGTIAASQSKDIAFLIMLAGPGTTGEEVLLTQTELILRENEKPENEIKKSIELAKRIYAALEEEENNKKVKKQLKKLYTEYNETLTAEEKETEFISEEIIKMTIEMLTSSWFRYFLNYDPQPYLRKITCPVLALNGEKDLQVYYKDNLDGIEKGLKAGGNNNFIIKKFPGLNHLFQTAETGLPNEYVKIEQTFSPDVLEFMTNWILRQSNK